MPNARGSKVIYLLPTLHLAACLIIAVLRLGSAWEFMLKVDFPMSVIIIAVSFSFDHPLVVFGILGTLWWYMLSRVAQMLVRQFRGDRKGNI